MTVQEHFRRLELMNMKYAGGQFVIENGTRSYQIAVLDAEDAAELSKLDRMLASEHANNK